MSTLTPSKPIKVKADGTLARVEWTCELFTKAAVAQIIPLMAAIESMHEAQKMFTMYYGDLHGPILTQAVRIKGDMAKKGQPSTPGKIILLLRWRGTNQMADRLQRIDARFHRTDPGAV